MNKQNPKNINYYDPVKLVSATDEPDGASFISLLCCSIGMFMRMKVIIWVAIFMMMSTFCRRKNGTSITTYLINLMMIIFALISTYMIQPPGGQIPTWFVCYIIKNMWFKQAASSVWNKAKNMVADQRSPGRKLMD